MENNELNVFWFLQLILIQMWFKSAADLIDLINLIDRLSHILLHHITLTNSGSESLVKFTSQATEKLTTLIKALSCNYCHYHPMHTRVLE